MALLTQACDPPRASAAKSSEVQAKVQDLVQRSRTRLSYVAAGGFWLGDPGPLMTEKLKQSGAILGPELKASDEGTQYTLDEHNKPPRWVTLDAFSIQQLKVTYGDFDVYVAANGLPKHPPMGDEKSFGRIWVSARKSDDTPAGVTWPQARGYCQWLATVTGLPFDLPTEAQWEFAASNGRKTHWEPMPTDNGIIEEGRNHPGYDWIKERVGMDGTLYPVGKFPPSMLKLHDLVGNGFEWTLDWYSPDAYQTMTQTHNPTGPATGTHKVKRGKSVMDDIAASGFPHTFRYRELPEGLTYKTRPWPYINEGFRCVVNQPAAISGTYVAGAPPVRNVLADRKSR